MLGARKLERYKEAKSFYNHVFSGFALRNCMSLTRDLETAEGHLMSEGAVLLSLLDVGGEGSN